LNVVDISKFQAVGITGSCCFKQSNTATRQPSFVFLSLCMTKRIHLIKVMSKLVQYWCSGISVQHRQN